MKSRQQITIEAVANRDRVLAHVRKMRELLGRGSLMELDERIGKSRGHMARVLRGKAELSIDELFRLMAAFERQPPEFMAGALGVDLEVYLRGLERETPRQVKLLKAALAETEPPDTLPTIKELKELWARDFDATEKACMGVLAAKSVEPALEAEAWGLLATVLRRRLAFSAAAYCLQISREVAKSERCLFDEAEVYRRTAYLAMDQCDHKEALTFSNTARNKFLELNCLAAAGKAIVASAITMRRSGQPLLAIDNYKLGLALVDAADVTHRFTANHGMGICYVLLGRFMKAETCLGESESVVRDSGQRGSPTFNFFLDWLRAEIALGRKECDTARQMFESLRQKYPCRIDAFNEACICLKLAKIYVLQGHSDEVRRLAHQMSNLLTPLRNQKFAKLALVEFIRASASGQVTVNLLDVLYLQLYSKQPLVLEVASR